MVPGTLLSTSSFTPQTPPSSQRTSHGQSQLKFFRFFSVYIFRNLFLLQSDFKGNGRFMRPQNIFQTFLTKPNKVLMPSYLQPTGTTCACSWGTMWCLAACPAPLPPTQCWAPTRCSPSSGTMTLKKWPVTTSANCAWHPTKPKNWKRRSWNSTRPTSWCLHSLRHCFSTTVSAWLFCFQPLFRKCFESFHCF